MIGIMLSLALIAPAEEVDLVSLYRSSPLEVRTLLRSALIEGRPMSEWIETLEELTGDHSFHDFRGQKEGLKQAIRLQQRGLEAWNLRHYSSAIAYYQKAYNSCLASDAPTEALFCLYFLAEIMAEQGRYRETLEYVNRAFLDLNARDCPFLATLLNESKGYALWFFDYLPDSIECFALSMQFWKSIGFASGIAGSWNNLACLYEQLQILSQADQCYRRALQLVERPILPETRFQILRNYAVFQKRRGNINSAILYLNRCRELSTVSPEEFRLAEAEILENEGLLDAFHSELLPMQIEKELLLSEFQMRRGEFLESCRSSGKALALSRDNGLYFYTRRAAKMMGRSFERAALFEKAAAVYEESIQQEQVLKRVGTLFPYRRIVSPFLDGWVRCQIKLHKPEIARRTIHRHARLRQLKAQLLLKNLPHIAACSDRLEQFAEIISAGSPILEQYVESEQVSNIRKADYTIVELWPDIDEVYVWIETASQTHFVVLPLKEKEQDLIEKIVSSYHSNRQALPRPPSSQSLELLQSAIFSPIEPLIPTRCILIIPHKKFQSIPFELLTGGPRSETSKEHIFSYLPSKPSFQVQNELERGNPLLFMPERFSQRPGAKREEAFLRQIFPRMRVIRHLRTGESLIAHWTHNSGLPQKRDSVRSTLSGRLRYCK